MKVQKEYEKIFTPQHTFATEQDARVLVKAAARDNEKAGGCCSGPGTAGSDYLKDKFQKEPEKFKDLNAKTIINGFLNPGSQGVTKDGGIVSKEGIVAQK